MMFNADSQIGIPPSELNPGLFQADEYVYMYVHRLSSYIVLENQTKWRFD